MSCHLTIVTCPQHDTATPFAAFQRPAFATALPMVHRPHTGPVLHFRQNPAGFSVLIVIEGYRAQPWVQTARFTHLGLSGTRVMRPSVSQPEAAAA